MQPHHFQQSDRYTESLVSGLARRISPYAWGVSALEIDEDVLKVGQFALKACSGLTQDGTVFRVPAAEDHPPALEVPEDDQGLRRLSVGSAAPARRVGG